MVCAIVRIDEVHSLLAVIDSDLCGLEEIFEASVRISFQAGSSRNDGSVARGMTEDGAN